MSEHESSFEVGESADLAAAPAGSGDGSPTLVRQRTYWQRARLFALRIATVIGAFLLAALFLTGGAATYTSRSQFCVSCHIMEPYYASWENSSHKDVACIKCHFPPGALEKVRGKMLGLVQLLKYVTRSAGPRPAAEISDASCLRCHDTRLLAGRVEFHGVQFDHQPHLTEVRRGKRLRCTSCHSQIVQGTHMTVTTSTCFLCHFKDGRFNEGLGACTRCHQIPEGTFPLDGGVEFSHELAYKRGVDCANCHGDLIRGNGDVPKDRCTACHNRPVDLERIGDDVFLHQVHVTDHKVDCLECHTEIQHSLDPHKIEHAASDCQSCHPNHHSEQIHMLNGDGGKNIAAARSTMTAARIACPTCHQTREVSPTGTVIWKASTAICTQCHDQAAADRLQAHHQQLEKALRQVDDSILRARDAVGASDLDETRKQGIEQRLHDLEDDVQFMRVGNSIHNMHYAGSLSRAVVDKLTVICRDLNIPEPAVDLPAGTGLIRE